jgi:membrane protein DedA with SNARE-associated domain
MPIDLQGVLDLIREHGEFAYAFVFGYAASNSLLLVLLAGFAANLGAFDLGKLILVCWVGAFVGDGVRFWLGRRYGNQLFASFPRLERGVLTVARLIERHYLWLPFVYRYPNGIRGVAGFAFGMSSLPKPIFHVMNFISAGLWSVSVVGAGYAFGQMSESHLSHTASTVSLVALITFLGLFWLLSKRLTTAMERSSPG